MSFQRHLIILSIGLIAASCSSRQKNICVRNVAYQHGYQAAQKGEAVDAASTDQSAVCQDYEAYSPTTYRSDFKAGYYKGIANYCSEFNFKKWGAADGKAGKESAPNAYTDDMKICLQDKNYKKKAEAIYQKSFTEAYCQEDRLVQVGISQAKEFQPLKVPSIGKRCKGAANKMAAAMRSAYKEQMKTNCTLSFWTLKGEQDARGKVSKASQLGKIQKCSANKREGFISAYSKSYNETRVIMMEEEKLAMEKKRQEEMLDLEKKKQQQAYELEKERIQVERERVQGQNSAFVFNPSYINRPYSFTYKGSRLSVRCSLENREGAVYVRNLSGRYLSFSGTWEIRYFRAGNQFIKSNDEYEHLTLSGNEEERFEDNFAPFDATACFARLKN